MIKQELINNLTKLYKNDPYVNEVLTSVGLNMDNIEAELKSLEKEYWFDSMSLFGINIVEKQLDFNTNPKDKIEDKRSQIEARWKANGKVNLNMIQKVCSSWKNGQVKISFTNGKIKLDFNSTYGIPDDLDGLMDILDEIKPAHLGLIYVFKYWLIEDIKTWTVEEWQSKSIEEFAFNIERG